MRLLKTCFLLVLLMSLPGLVAGAQSLKATDQPAEPSSATPTSVSATKEEVDQLRKKVAAQDQTIEELKVMVEKLVADKTQAVAANPQTSDGAQLLNATLTQGGAAQATPSPKPAEKKDSGPALTAGWSGEHFYIKSADGKFQLQPYG